MPFEYSVTSDDVLYVGYLGVVECFCPRVTGTLPVFLQ